MSGELSDGDLIRSSSRNHIDTFWELNYVSDRQELLDDHLSIAEKMIYMLLTVLLLLLMPNAILRSSFVTVLGVSELMLSAPKGPKPYQGCMVTAYDRTR
jgi:hypothetical protein